MKESSQDSIKPISGHNQGSSSVLTKISSILSQVSVEPVCLFFALSFALYGVQVSNLYIEKTCKVGSFFFGNGTFSDEVCDNLFNGSFPDEQKTVQSTTAKVQMVHEFLKQIPTVIFALFVGPWSDRAGRKLLLLMPTIGYCLLILVYILNVYFFEELVVEFLWMDSISSFFGGFLVLLIGAYGHLSDTTSPSSRTLRMALMDVMFYIAHAVGGFLNSYIYSRLGYFGNFGISFLLFVSAFFVVLILFKNKTPNQDVTSGPGPFSLKNVAESFKVLSKPRADNMRHIVSLLILCFQLRSVGYLGLHFIEYFYIRRKFAWSDMNTLVRWYNNFKSFDAMMNIVATFVVLPFIVRILKLSNITISILATLAYIIWCSVFYLSEDKNVILLALGCSLFIPFLNTALRSSMSIIVGSGDAGKVFACVGSLQAITGFAAPLYNILYIATMDSNLGAVYLVTAGIFTLLLIIVLYIQIFVKRIERDIPAVIPVSYFNISAY